MPSATYVVIKGRFVIASLVALVLIIGLAPPGRTSYVRPGVNKMVTVNSDGTQAAHPSQWNVRNNPCGFWTASDISANAQHVAFVSLASNLDSNDINGICDVFVHERKTGTTERVSVASDGTPALGIPDKDFSGHPSISANGRYVAFTSSAPNLVAGDVNLAADVFVHDRKTGTTERISVASDDAQPIINLPGLTSESHLPSISANGRHVAFSSKAALVAEDVNGGFDVYVRDRRLQETVLASVPDGTNPSVTDPASGLVNSLVADSFGATQVALSGNGRYVVFSSLGPDYVSGDSNFAADVFVHDLKTKDTERVSVDSSGEQSEAVFESNTRGFVSQTISDDGRLIAFSSAGETLVPNDTNRQPDGARVMDVFVHDRETGRTERVAVTSAGEQGELKIGRAHV